MNLLFDKSFNDLNLESEETLKTIGFSTAPGSIAKLLLNIINKQLSSFYDTLRLNHLNCFLSTSTGEFLDSIGILLNCPRLYEEEDLSYRYRISKQTLISATANETAIRLAALSVVGVQDIVLRNYSFGIGSFSVFVITDQILADETVLLNVRNNINEVVGYGIKYNVDNPSLNLITISVNLLIKKTVLDSVQQDIKSKVKEALKNYFISINIGDPIIIDKITQVIMSVDNNIIDYTCSDFRIDNRKALFINQNNRWNERFMLSRHVNSIIVN